MTATFKAINTFSLIVKSMVKPKKQKQGWLAKLTIKLKALKQKQGWLANNPNKQTKKTCI